MEHLQHRSREVLIQMIAGGSAGFLEVLITYPLDLVKTRLQIQYGDRGGKFYDGVLDCFAKTYREEGLKYFYRGIVPPLASETPKRAIKFLSFEQLKELSKPGPTPRTYFLAGLGSGVVEALFSNPFEVVKINCQACRKTGADAPTSWTITKEIISHHGFGRRGLYKGLTATVYRNAVYSSIYFGSYHSLREMLDLQNTAYGTIAKLGIGFLAGGMACCANIPFDVAKSRIQGPQPLGQVKYTSTIGSVVVIYKEEGIRALYAGLVPKILRLGPGGAVMFIVYEYVYDFLSMM